MVGKFVARRWLYVTTFAVLASWTTLAIAQDKKPEPPKEKDIVATVKDTADMKTFAKLLDSSGVAATLKEKGPYTVFAPTDEAFAKLGKEKLADLEKPENKAKLEKLLKQHIVMGAHAAAAIEKMKSVKTLAEQEVAITVAEKVIKVGDAKVTKADVKAANGLIHVVDAVLVVKE